MKFASPTENEPASKVMTANNFTYIFKTERTPEEVYKLLLDPRNWWWGLYDEEINGISVKQGDEFSFRAGEGAHYSKQKLIELMPSQKIVWQIIDSNLSFVEEKNEWNGTTISFDIQRLGDKTEVTFIHKGLTPQFKCYDSCAAGWTSYMNQLRQHLS